MIRAYFVHNKQKVLYGFMITGHAGYASSGYDIICSAVSALSLNTINSIEELCSDSGCALVDETTGTIKFKLTDKPSNEANLLLQSLEIGLKAINKEYSSQYIHILYKEV